MKKSKLILKPLSNGKAILLDDYVYSINGYDIKVFRGFITDGASVPKSCNGYIILMANTLMQQLYTIIYTLHTTTLELIVP